MTAAPTTPATPMLATLAFAAAFEVAAAAPVAVPDREEEVVLGCINYSPQVTMTTKHTRWQGW